MENITLEHKPMTAKKTTFVLEDIESIYNGKGDCCRCGCGGEYIYPTNPENNEYRTAEPKRIERMVKWFLKMANAGHEVTSIENYIFEINMSTSGETDRVYTIYLNEKKFKN